VQLHKLATSPRTADLFQKIRHRVSLLFNQPACHRWFCARSSSASARAGRSDIQCRLSKIRVINLVRRRRAAPAPLAVRFGIHLGDAVVDNVGSADRVNSTVLGNSVNQGRAPRRAEQGIRDR
jgi:class 3 adenylate cyclase